ncbi:MAG TPA: hypothetical protein VM621_05285 [Luteibacter sp.]|uniref:hypothetical protein n=1 Tax=Luteibacter sp. TaxID=1886636 RepID=UPI002BD0CB63|nr:hypothetical protein [Luteibacter sp.]HVI54449.1 hypothetical protein [Luteibacter sp.]
MSYAGRMYFRMFSPGLMVLGAGALAAAAMKAVQQVPGRLGILSLYSDLPGWIMAGSVTLALCWVTVQAVRVKLWDRGAITSCYVCGCILGTARAPRRGLGMTRHCLGCGKVHGVNHRLASVVVPLAVAVSAVTDNATAPVRRVRSSL